jgi:hypothetical protein
MSWRSSDSAGDPHVKWRWRAGRGASGLAMVVPHAVAAAVSGKFRWNVPVKVTLSN